MSKASLAVHLSPLPLLLCSANCAMRRRRGRGGALTRRGSTADGHPTTNSITLLLLQPLPPLLATCRFSSSARRGGSTFWTEQLHPSTATRPNFSLLNFRTTPTKDEHFPGHTSTITACYYGRPKQQSVTRTPLANALLRT